MNCTQQGGSNDCCQDICFLACKEKTATSFIGFPEYHCANNLRRLPMQLLSGGALANMLCFTWIMNLIEMQI